MEFHFAKPQYDIMAYPVGGLVLVSRSKHKNETDTHVFIFLEAPRESSEKRESIVSRIDNKGKAKILTNGRQS